jgi:outer membrane protein
MNLDYQFVDPTIPARIDSVEMDSTRHRYVSVAELSTRALAARPDYMSAKENLSASQSAVTQARSGYYPSITAGAGFNLTNTELQTIADNKNLSWGINLRWNIFDAFRTNMSLQAAQAGEVSAQASLAQAERDITGQVKKAILDFDAARKQVEASHKGLVSATEDRKIAEEKYNLGAGTLLDLLTANAGLVNAQASDVNATYNYITAKKNLEYAIAERVY